ncbi:NAD(P)/FAD-dependent oxidoreductase [Spirosoma pomorum]
MTTHYPVIIVGAGMAGLTCAVYLKQAGIDALLLEADDAVGGRVRTDVVDGFQLDRGFQILLTAYPEAQRLLNYTALDLKSFRSGALIHQPDTTKSQPWISLINPFQEPTSVFQTLASPVGTLSDKVHIVELLRRTQELPIDDLFYQTPATTLDFLRSIGFSEQIIDRFFRPFFGGVFLEDALNTSSNFFEFCFRMFFVGDAAIPAKGIGAIPNQLANRLSPDQIQLNSPVQRLEGRTLTLGNGQSVSADHVILAVDATQAARLTGHATPTDRAFTHTTCTYFAAPGSPNDKQLLMLNPHRASAVHNLAVMSDVAPAYAPTGQSLISVSTQELETINEEALTERILRELTNWFGEEVSQWRYLRTYHIPKALPAYTPYSVHQPLRLGNNMYQCGDWTAYPSLNAAMQTGRQVAELIIEKQS